MRVAEPDSVAQPVERQPSLFREPSPKVIPIPTLTPLRPANRAAAPKRVSNRQPGRAHRTVSDSQQRLDFHDAPAPARPRSDEAIYCDAPVAQPAHRLLAGLVDGGMVVIGALMALTALFVFAEGLSFTRTNLLLMTGVLLPVAVLYRGLWCLADSDTPGMRFAGLQLVDFDGRPPKRKQRAIRHVAGVLSVLSAGVGLFWALVDEESLTWHDHISKTFPTVRSRGR
jgi:uncharacterized RDD family membrane protein YckC